MPTNRPFAHIDPAYPVLTGLLSQIAEPGLTGRFARLVARVGALANIIRVSSFDMQELMEDYGENIIARMVTSADVTGRPTWVEVTDGEEYGLLVTSDEEKSLKVMRVLGGVGGQPPTVPWFWGECSRQPTVEIDWLEMADGLSCAPEREEDDEVNVHVGSLFGDGRLQGRTPHATASRTVHEDLRMAALAVSPLIAGGLVEAKALRKREATLSRCFAAEATARRKRSPNQPLFHISPRAKDAAVPDDLDELVAWLPYGSATREGS